MENGLIDFLQLCVLCSFLVSISINRLDGRMKNILLTFTNDSIPVETNKTKKQMKGQEFAIVFLSRRNYSNENRPQLN